MSVSSTDDLKALVRDTDVFLFDCDGVLWKNKTVIKGSAEMYAWLLSMKKTVYFVTNNSSKSRDGYIGKFASLGMPVEGSQIYTTSYAAATYLHKRGFKDTGKLVYIISGDTGLMEELDKVGIPYHSSCKTNEHARMVVDSNTTAAVEYDRDIGAVIVGKDITFNYFKLHYAQLCINNNPDCLFIATNTDACTNYSDDDQLWAGTGGMVGAVQGCVGHTKPAPDMMCGKPNGLMLDDIMASLPGVDRARVCMVGDRLDTDMEFGKGHGLRTLLVLSGVTSPQQLDAETNPLRKPDFVTESVHHLHHLCADLTL
jgi:phosphoglycolate/pyridoxal phosphate phosphatase family enzyme